MIKVNDFNQLVSLAMREKGHAHMRPVIAKELLHYDILFALEDNGLLDHLTFQGGTALRLCYGADRFSEDLDFVGGSAFSSAHLMNMKNCLEQYIGERYGLDIEVKEPKKIVNKSQGKDIQVNKWQIKITTEPEKKDIPKQKIKIEVANVPAYSKSPQPLKQNYSFLPDGYSDLIIMTESLDEIMADKIVAFVGCQKYIRYRDIWDLRWLKQKGAMMNPSYVQNKIQDYKEKNFVALLDERIKTLDAIIHSKGFLDEMQRFLPTSSQERTLQKNKFLDFLANENTALFKEVKAIL